MICISCNFSKHSRQMGCTAGLMVELNTSLVNISALRHCSDCLSEDLYMYRHLRADAWDGLEFSSDLSRLYIVLGQSIILFSSALFDNNSTLTFALW